ncbi:LysR family transcriptional regulator [Paenarthrobacter ureafaciens]|uniref:LysR family transcriptional regulator n=1 Tax=Paenarthrobacter ureafaciens TaxID=37931 RepID=UPI0015B999B3|nr:LysR family transcriptional regulator [Paenarthrobacter ureafaciens]MEC3854083.1 LysR family transcriptional regulator [Paenarthrobacter ureafaciens]NWL26336.1 LysR family transcriptional regulator [Paenarthrobacter ureafaciens]
MLNPVHLRTLSVVLRTGSFADAAREIGYTGSAVSQQVAALERAVQAPLVERDAQSIRPTEAAKFLAARAADIINALSHLEDDMKGFSKGNYGLLRLGSFSTASQRLLPAGLASYLRRHPNSTVELEEGGPAELAALIREANLDVAVVFHHDLVPQKWPANVVAVPLLAEELLLLVPESHRLAAADSITMADVAEENWVSGKEDSSGDACLRHLCAGAGYQPRVNVRSNNYDAIRGMVRSGLGIALVPALDHVPTDGIVATRLGGCGARRHVSALRQKTEAGVSVTSILNCLGRSADRLAASTPGLIRQTKQPEAMAPAEYLAGLRAS